MTMYTDGPSGPSAAADPAPQSILQIAAVTPSGMKAPALELAELGVYIRSKVGTLVEVERNARHALRDQLYRDGGCAYMCQVIDRVFQDEKVKKLRKEWVPHARFTNPLKRIIRKISTVYAKPAKRSVKNGDENYQKLLKELRFDEQMLQLSRLLNLHRAMLVGFRVRLLPSGAREPVMDIATPANVRALTHPNDDKLVIGWIVRACYTPARATPDAPIWNLWTDHEVVGLRDDMSPITDTYRVHGLGVNPWVPVTLEPPQPGFWPGEDGEDLVAARIAVWMQGVLMLKESKSATKQPVIQGDGTTTARGQAADSESPIELSDGQTITTVDMSMDLEMFQGAADHITHHAALDYEMSEAIVNNQGVQSAESRELMMQPLYEIRDQQQIPLRQFEERYCVVQSAVCKIDLPAMAFESEGFEIQFGNEKLKLDPAKEHDLFVKRRGAGLTSTVRFMMESRPGLTLEQAQLELNQNIAAETVRNVLMRPLQRMAGSMGADNPSPEDAGTGGSVAPGDPNVLPANEPPQDSAA